MFLYGFDAVLGTAWIEAATVSEKRTDNPLIELHQKEKKRAHHGSSKHTILDIYLDLYIF